MKNYVLWRWTSIIIGVQTQSSYLLIYIYCKSVKILQQVPQIPCFAGNHSAFRTPCSASRKWRSWPIPCTSLATWPASNWPRGWKLLAPRSKSLVFGSQKLGWFVVSVTDGHCLSSCWHPHIYSNSWACHTQLDAWWETFWRLGAARGDDKDAEDHAGRMMDKIFARILPYSPHLKARMDLVGWLDRNL